MVATVCPAQGCSRTLIGAAQAAQPEKASEVACLCAEPFRGIDGDRGWVCSMTDMYCTLSAAEGQAQIPTMELVPCFEKRGPLSPFRVARHEKLIEVLLGHPAAE